MTLTDYMCQEEREEDDVLSLKTAEKYGGRTDYRHQKQY